MTGSVRDNCYPHFHLLPTHLHLASADFIRFLPVATSAHLQIRMFAYYHSLHPVLLSAEKYKCWNAVRVSVILIN